MMYVGVDHLRHHLVGKSPARGALAWTRFGHVYRSRRQRMATGQVTQCSDNIRAVIADALRPLDR